MPKTVRQSVTFRTSPSDVYEVLMDSHKHAKFTNSQATISRAVGGKFSAYDGYIEGVNLGLYRVRRSSSRGAAVSGRRITIQQ